MPHSIPEVIELTNKFNKVVKTTKPRKFTADGRDKTAWSTGDATETLDKPIQIYRQWYRFLQLAIELEKRNTIIITEEVRTLYPKPVKDKWGKYHDTYLKPTKHKVKVNWSKYKKWGNPEMIEKTSFNDWWKEHRQIFFSDTAELVNKKSDWIDNINFQYLRFDKRKRVNDVVAEIRQLLSNTKRTVSSVSEYPVYGMPNMRTLQNRYNTLILKLTNKNKLKDEDILKKMDFYRPTELNMGKRVDDAETVYKVSTSHGRVIRDLIRPAKVTLLAVCDGCFARNPHKTYMSSDKKVEEAVSRATKNIKKPKPKIKPKSKKKAS